MATTTLADLPAACLVDIFKRCNSVETAASLACTCSSLRDAETVAAPELYSRLAVREYGERMGNGPKSEAKCRLRSLRAVTGVRWRKLEDDSDTKKPPPAMNGAALARLSGSGALVLFGGSGHQVSRHSQDLSNRLWVSRDEGKSWTIVDAQENLPEPRWGHSLTSVTPTSAMLLGGFGGGVVHRDAWTLHEHDDGSFSWDRAPAMDEGRAFHTATVVKGWLIVAGGLGDDGTHDTHIMFHLRNGTWTVPELQLLPPVGCAGHFAVWLDKKNVLVIGGGCGRNPGGGPGPDMYFTHTMVMDAIWDFPSDAPPRWRQNRAKRIEQPTTARCAISAAIGESGVLYWGGADVNHTFNRGAHFLNLDGPPETWRYRTLDTPLGSRLAPSREGATAFSISAGIRIVGGASFTRATDFSTVWDLRIVDKSDECVFHDGIDGYWGESISVDDDDDDDDIE